MKKGIYYTSFKVKEDNFWGKEKKKKVYFPPFLSPAFHSCIPSLFCQFNYSAFIAKKYHQNTISKTITVIWIYYNTQNFWSQSNSTFWFKSTTFSQGIEIFLTVFCSNTNKNPTAETAHSYRLLEQICIIIFIIIFVVVVTAIIIKVCHIPFCKSLKAEAMNIVESWSSCSSLAFISTDNRRVRRWFSLCSIFREVE